MRKNRVISYFDNKTIPEFFKDPEVKVWIGKVKGSGLPDGGDAGDVLIQGSPQEWKNPVELIQEALSNGGTVIFTQVGGKIQADINWDGVITNPEDVPEVPGAVLMRTNSPSTALKRGDGNGGIMESVLDQPDIDTLRTPAYFEAGQGIASFTSVVGGTQLFAKNTNPTWYGGVDLRNSSNARAQIMCTGTGWNEIVYIGPSAAAFYTSTANMVFSTLNPGEWRWGYGVNNNVSAKLTAAGDLSLSGKLKNMALLPAYASDASAAAAGLAIGDLYMLSENNYAITQRRA